MISHYSNAVSSRDHAEIVASQFTLRSSCQFSGNPYNTLVGVTLSGTAGLPAGYGFTLNFTLCRSAGAVRQLQRLQLVCIVFISP